MDHNFENNAYDYDGIYIIKNGKCVGKQSGNFNILSEDDYYEVPYQSYKLKQKFNQIKNQIINLQHLHNFCLNEGYIIDIKGVVLYENNVLGKFNKKNNLYSLDINETTIYKHNIYYIETKKERDIILSKIKQNLIDKKTLNQISKLSLICPRSGEELQYEMKKTKHQKFVKENVLEEVVKAYMHPKRINMLLNMGYSIDELDAIM